MPDNGFAKAYHLRKAGEFKNVFRKGKKVITSTLVFHVLETGSERSRLGLAVSKRVGNAVVRNRIKRRIREVFRTSKGSFRRCYDMVVYPRREIMEREFKDYVQSFETLRRRIEGRDGNSHPD